MTYQTMSDNEIQEAVRKITRTSHSKEEVKRRIREELEYPYVDSIAITSTSSGPMIMFMLMMHGHQRTITA